MHSISRVFPGRNTRGFSSFPKGRRSGKHKLTFVHLGGRAVGGGDGSRSRKGGRVVRRSRKGRRAHPPVSMSPHALPEVWGNTRRHLAEIHAAAVATLHQGAAI